MNCVPKVQICPACGSEIVSVSFQARAADEPARTIESCPQCPLMTRRISIATPKQSNYTSLPKHVHRRFKSAPVSRSQGTASRTYIEMVCPHEGWAGPPPIYHENIRMPLPVIHSDHAPARRGYVYAAGEFKSMIVVHRSSSSITPVLIRHAVDTYHLKEEDTVGAAEKDGEVAVYPAELGLVCYLHKRVTEKGVSLTVAIEAGAGTPVEIRRAVYALHSIPWLRFSITDVLTVAELSMARNLSPRAWDSAYRNLSGHVFLHKPDGERCYGIIYGVVFYLFRKGRSLPLVGWRVLDRERVGKPIILDLENTVSSGCILIDMITDRHGSWSPARREYLWVLKEFSSIAALSAPIVITVRRCYGSLSDAAHSVLAARYPTDGVLAIQAGGTTSKKMKKERSVELQVGGDLSLRSSDGKVVVEWGHDPGRLTPGTVVELRFRLMSTGKKILCSSPFVRNDKAAANNSTAIGNVLASFRGVAKDDEIRRRGVLTWCYSLRSSLIDRALSAPGARKLVMDIGTGTGQSLDDLTAGRGVSYILVERNAQCCLQISRRLRLGRIETDPRRLLSVVRSLKSGSSTYCIMNCGLEDILADREVMTLLSSELKAAVCTFSAHYVIPAVYELTSSWGIPVIGCVYTYDGVEVGECLVDTLGVTMRRRSPNECTVKWGQDDEYSEPYTLASYYEVFCSTTRAIDQVDHPSEEIDRDVYNICSKVLIVSSL